ncbi:MAG TPA: hypothetical protein VFY22_08765, partial [Hydrogenophaga sp.]|nr:hypothetical protein [Hydrogenophaga sp.]
MTETTTPHAPRTLSSLGFLLVLFLMGIALPAFTLGYELTTHASAQVLFDPVPTAFHGVLIALVPLSNAWLLWALTRDDPSAHPRLAHLQAFALGLALFYALLYLPITPLAPFAVLFMGLGLLPLAPLLSLIVGWRGRRLLERRLLE